MNELVNTSSGNNNAGSGLDTALELAKQSDIEGARTALGISSEFSDDELIETLIGISKGLELLQSQKSLQAHIYFKKALPVLDASSDNEAKLIIHTLTNFSEGLSKLFSGDAHAASELLSVSSEAIEKISFFIPEFKLSSLSLKAASFIALARTHLNAANFSMAEEAFGKCRQVHNELLNQIDINNDEHIPYFIEIYGIRFELVLMFLLSIDLPSLDLNMMRKRIESVKEDIESLKEIVDRLPKGPVQTLASTYPVIYSVIDTLYVSLDILILKRRLFKKEEVEALVGTEKDIYKVRTLVQSAGERGRGILHHADQIKRLQQNLLLAGKVATQSFGRFSGTVSLLSLMLLIIVIHLTIEPVGYFAAFYFLGALILSLIVGFGFGALRFIPLIKILSSAIKKDSEKG